MPRNIRVHKCTDTNIGKLVPGFLTGKLQGRKFQTEREQIVAHSRKCKFCRELIGNAPFMEVLLPILRKIMDQEALTFEEILEALAKKANEGIEKPLDDETPGYVN